METSKKNNYWWIWIIVVIVVLVLIVVYVVTLGSVDVGQKENLPTEFKDSKEDAIRKHAALKMALNNKIALRDKLNRRFRFAYVLVRIALVALWLGPLYALYHFGIAKDIGEVLTYSQASFIIILIFNFVTFGSLNNLNEFINLIKARVENWVWGKNVTLPKEIEKDQQEISNLSLTIAATENHVKVKSEQEVVNQL